MQPTSGLRVLSAGDQETSALLAALLGFEHIEVTAANTIAEAIQMVTSRGFDVHILGTRFPDGDGFELCSELKRIAPFVPNIFYTGDTRREDRARGIARGADAYLLKPYRGDLGAVVIELIEEGRQRRDAYINKRSAMHRSIRRSARIL